MLEDTIIIVTDDTPETTIADGAKGWGAEVRSENPRAKESAISIYKLEQEMSRFLELVSRLFYQAERQADQESNIKLDEIQLLVEISSEGEVKLIGSGVKAAGKGAITLKFKRK